MKANSTISRFFLFALLLMLTINFSCRKIDIQPPAITIDSVLPLDAVSHKFFGIHLPTDPIVIALKNKISSENQQKPFIEKLVKYAGYPVWNKAIVSIFKETKPTKKVSTRCIQCYCY